MTSDSLIWIREGPNDVGVYPRKTQYVRRSHKKSRSGCSSCKTRRVKVSPGRSIRARSTAILTPRSAMRKSLVAVNVSVVAQIAITRRDPPQTASVTEPTSRPLLFRKMTLKRTLRHQNSARKPVWAFTSLQHRSLEPSIGAVRTVFQAIVLRMSCNISNRQGTLPAALL